MRKLFSSVVTAAVISCTVSMASATTVVEVLPGDIGLGGNDVWRLANVAGGRSGAISGEQAQTGDGSFKLTTSNNAGKIDLEYTWGSQAGLTLGNLNALSFDFFRDEASTVGGHFTPAVRLIYQNGNQRGYLIWEGVYNTGDFKTGSVVIEDQWHSVDLIDENFWQRRTSPVSGSVEAYGITLEQWANGANPTGAHVLNEDTLIIGINIGLGSGWGNNSYIGYVDNVRVGFDGGFDTTWDFNLTQTPATLPVPEPATAALGLMALSSLAMATRRRRA